MFKDKAKFDVQNPVVSPLYEQVIDNKKKEKALLRKLDEAPSTKEIYLQKRLYDLTNFNRLFRGNNDDIDDDDSHNNNNFNSGSNSYLPTPEFRGNTFPPMLPVTPATPSSSHSLTVTQRFLLQPEGGGKVAEAIGQELTRSTPQRISFPDTITTLFPSSSKIMEEKLDETIEEEPSFSEENDESISEIQMSVKELNDGNLPSDLQFFFRR